MKKPTQRILLLCVLLFSHSVQLKADLKTMEFNSGEKSLHLAKSHLRKASELTASANYPQAYDELWSALSFADSLNNSNLKYQAWQKLSMLYSIFENREMAINCIDSMFVHAHDCGADHKVETKLQLHFSAGITYRMNQKYTLAQEHIQLCEHLCDSLHKTFADRIYILTEKAHLLSLSGKYTEAEQLLQKISSKLPKSHSYNAIVYSMWGDLYRAKGNRKEAISYFKKSLHTISEQKIRIGLKVDLLEKLADLYHSVGDDTNAFRCMAESKNLGESLFGSRSENNHQLFQIKDNYREAIAKNERIKKKQQLILYQNQKKNLKRDILFLSLLLVIVGIASTTVIALLKRKHSAEEKLKKERSAAQLQIKNKELTATALQLLEKDNVLNEIKQILNDVNNKIDDTSMHRIRSTIQVNVAQSWKNFEARFVKVNSKFYESLSQKHPELSPNELKICAFIKLNFTSKEIAGFMGVHPESVNKARYRLRKKLGLDKEENLGSYIGKF